MILEIFLPSESLAFEYHGAHHYYDVYHIGPQWAYQQKDQEKRLACKKLNITLIEIPYWWDYSKDSLVATIQIHKESLLLPLINSEPIPDQPEEAFLGNFEIVIIEFSSQE